MAMTNREINVLAKLLNGCKIHSISSEIFMPLIESITALNKADMAAMELRKAVVEKLGMLVDEQGRVSTDDSEKAQLFNDSIKEIDDKNVEVKFVILDSEQFKKLAEENKHLVAGDLAFLHSFLCR